MIKKVKQIIERQKAQHPGQPSFILFLRGIVYAVQYRLFHLKIKFTKDGTFNNQDDLWMCSLFPKNILDIIIADINPKSVLDVGCGTGMSLHESFSIAGSASTDVFFSDNNTGFFIKDFRLHKTTNAGASWTQLDPALPAGATYNSLFLTSNSNGWIISGKKVFKTDGNSIGASVTVSSSSSLTGIYALSPTLVYVSSQSGEIFKSVDGGLSFALISQLPTASGWSDISFINEMSGYCTAGRRIYKTLDGAATWSPVVQMGSQPLIEIHFTDASHGWACTDDSTILIYKQ